MKQKQTAKGKADALGAKVVEAEKRLELARGKAQQAKQAYKKARKALKQAKKAAKLARKMAKKAAKRSKAKASVLGGAALPRRPGSGRFGERTLAD